MSSIGNLGSMGSMMAMQGMHRRPDPSQMAEKLFSKLDSANQGYLQKTDLASALGSISATTDVDAIFTQLDGDSDGKITQQEFSESVTKLAEQLDQQFQGMRMQQAMGGPGGPGGMGGMPPPPPPPDDEGFTEEELTSQLEEIGTTDSKRASLISNILENFEAADTDGDGKVSFQEAMAYDKANASSQTTGEATTSSATSDVDGQWMLQIMRLMQAYGIGPESEHETGAVSVTA